MIRQISYELFTLLAHFDGTLGMPFNMGIMAQRKVDGKQRKADARLIVRLEHSVSPDAEMRLHQAYSLAFQVVVTTGEEPQGSGGHVRQDPNSAENGPN